MAVGSKFNTVTTANTIGQLRTDHNLLADELSLFANTTGLNHGTLSILSVKGTANVSANATFSGQNTSVTGTFTVGGARIATNTQLQSVLSNTNSWIQSNLANTNSWIQSNLANTNLAIADRLQVANASATYIPLSGGTFTGDVNFGNNAIENGMLKGHGVTGVNLGNTAGSITLNLNAGNYFYHTIDADVTYSFANSAVSGNACGFILEMDGAGDHTITWPTNVKWAAQTAPTLTSGQTDILVFLTRNNGTVWRGIESSIDSR